MKKVIGQHGDCILYQADSIPKTAKRVEWKKGFILEKGEGVHTHTIETECEIYMDGDRMYLKETASPIEIAHEEHGVKVVESPTKIVYKEIEQEFSYEEMEARKTID